MDIELWNIKYFLKLVDTHKDGQIARTCKMASVISWSDLHIVPPEFCMIYVVTCVLGIMI